MTNYIENKRIFLDEVYPLETTKETQISNYLNNLLPIEKILNKDLMYFNTEEIENLLINMVGVSGGYKQSLFSFMNSYCEYCVDKGYININPCAVIKPSEIIYNSIQQLMKGFMGVEQFNNTLRILESKTTILSSTMLALLLARGGVLGSKSKDLINIEEEDIDLRNEYINIYEKTNNHEDYGILLSSIPFYPHFKTWYEKLIEIKSYEAMGTRRNSTIEYIPSPYVLKRTNYTNTSEDVRVSPNTILNQINMSCLSAGIPRISLSKLQQSRRLDFLLDIRSKRKLNEQDFKDVIKLINYNCKSYQVLVNFKNFWYGIGGDEILSNNKIEVDNSGEEFVKDLRVKINYF